MWCAIHDKTLRSLARYVNGLVDHLHRDLFSHEEVGWRVDVKIDLLNIDLLINQFFAGGRPGDIAVEADQYERLTGDIHAARIVAGAMKVHFTINAR